MTERIVKVEDSPNKTAIVVTLIKEFTNGNDFSKRDEPKPKPAD